MDNSISETVQGILIKFDTHMPFNICHTFFSDFLFLGFWIFDNFFNDFLIMGVYGSENFKTLLLLQMSTDQIQFISESTLGGPSQNLFFGILNFGFVDF